MKKLSIETQSLGNTILLNLEGYFNELAKLPEINPTSLLRLEINFSKVSYINSAGIGIWVRWIDDIEKRAADGFEILLTECPRAIVSQLANVMGFLSKRAVVGSFFVPYFSEQTDECRDVLFRLGHEYRIGKTAARSTGLKSSVEASAFSNLSSDFAPPRVIDSKGNVMAPDVDPSKYFAFLGITSSSN